MGFSNYVFFLNKYILMDFSMLLICPHCQYSAELSAEMPAQDSVLVSCPKCHKQFRYSSAPPDAPRPEHTAQQTLSTSVQNHTFEEPKTEEENIYVEVPFEDPDYNFVSGLTTTIKRVMFYPGQFFRFLPPKTEGSHAKPILFTFVLTYFSFFFAIIWEFTGLTIQNVLYNITSRPELLPPGHTELVIVIFITGLISLPISILSQLYVGSGIVHLALRIFGAKPANFYTTFRVFSYGIASLLPLSIIPIIGPVIVGIYQLVVIIIGLKEAHSTSYGLVVLSVLLPPILLALFIAILFAFVALLIGAAVKMNQFSEIITLLPLA